MSAYCTKLHGDIERFSFAVRCAGKVWGDFDMHFLVVALIALIASANAKAEEYILAIQPGGPYTATPGGEIARIQKQRPLPNAFGFGDIFGRKVETGLIQFVYFGQAPDGKAMIRRIDVDVLSTATTMSRTPGFIWGQGQAWGTFSGGSGQFGAREQVFGMSPTDETNTVLPPRAVDFLADPSQPIPLPTGHVVSIHSIQPQSITFSVTGPRSPKEAPAKPVSRSQTTSDKPGWRPW